MEKEPSQQQDQDPIVPEIYTSAIESYTPTEIQTRLLQMADAGILKVRAMIEFSSSEELEAFKQALNEQEENLIQDSESQDEESEREKQATTHQQSMDIEQKKAIIIQRHYSKQISEISNRFSTKLIFTANKIKLFTDSDDKIDLCMKYLSILSQKIEVRRVTKGGPILYQSEIYAERLLPIRILSWQSNYYFYFNRDEIDSDRAHNIIEETEQLEHFAFYFTPKYFGNKIYMQLVQNLYGKYVQEKILKAVNQSEKEEFRSEISKDGKSVLYHSKNLNYLIQRHEEVKNKLANQTFLFLLNFKPGVSQGGIDTISKSIKPFNKYVEKDFCINTKRCAVGIIIGKYNLKLILNNTKENYRKVFGNIFEKVYKVNEDQVAMVLYLAGITQAKRKFIKTTLQPNFRLDGLDTHLLFCLPKEFGTNFAQVYLTSINKIILFSEPSLDSTVDISRNQTTNNTTSIIPSQSFINQSLTNQQKSEILNRLNETRMAQMPVANTSDYQFNLNLVPKYGKLQRPNANFQIGKKAKAVNKEVQKVTGQISDSQQVIINEIHQLVDDPFSGRPTVTLLMNENILFRETQNCHLYKIQLGGLTNGYLVQADITNLQEHSNYFKGTNAAIYRPTHKCILL